jgi:hypothetical protein
MKTTKLISGVVSILVVLAFTLGYAEEKKAYVPKDDEELYGTWVNEDYSGGLFGMRKRSIHPDRTWEVFNFATDTTSGWRGTVTITDKWTDSEGNIWYKTYLERADREGIEDYRLCKISSSGSAYEYVTSHVDYPTEMDSGHYTYRIYYRK